MTPMSCFLNMKIYTRFVEVINAGFQTFYLDTSNMVIYVTCPGLLNYAWPANKQDEIFRSENN